MMHVFVQLYSTSSLWKCSYTATFENVRVRLKYNSKRLKSQELRSSAARPADVGGVLSLLGMVAA